jgi:hypothetical protein
MRVAVGKVDIPIMVDVSVSAAYRRPLPKMLLSLACAVYAQAVCTFIRALTSHNNCVYIQLRHASGFVIRYKYTRNMNIVFLAEAILLLCLMV